MKAGRTANPPSGTCGSARRHGQARFVKALSFGGDVKAVELSALSDRQRFDLALRRLLLSSITTRVKGCAARVEELAAIEMAK